MIAADIPASQTPWVGMRSGPRTSGASPENGGSAYGSLPQTTSVIPTKNVSSPAVRTRVLLLGRRRTAGTKLDAPTSRLKSVAQTTAATAAGSVGQPNATWK